MARKVNVTKGKQGFQRTTKGVAPPAAGRVTQNPITTSAAPPGTTAVAAQLRMVNVLREKALTTHDPDRLLSLACNSEPLVRNGVAGRWDAPAYVLQRLAKDEDGTVAIPAQHSLMRQALPELTGKPVEVAYTDPFEPGEHKRVGYLIEDKQHNVSLHEYEDLPGKSAELLYHRSGVEVLSVTDPRTGDVLWSPPQDALEAAREQIRVRAGGNTTVDTSGFYPSWTRHLEDGWQARLATCGEITVKNSTVEWTRSDDGAWTTSHPLALAAPGVPGIPPEHVVATADDVTEEANGNAQWRRVVRLHQTEELVRDQKWERLTGGGGAS